MYRLWGIGVAGVLLYLFAIVFAQTGELTDLLENESAVQENAHVAYDGEFRDALAWMHDKGMTRFDEVDAFRPYDFLTRQESAKFFSQFAKETLFKVLDQTSYCFFDDLEGADVSLKNYILESCMFHLFAGSGGKFFPTQQLTKGQAMTVLIRAIDGPKEETGTHWWAAYRQRAWDLGLTVDNNLDNGAKPVTRYETAILLYRAGKYIEQHSQAEAQE